jgi:hypothetical protein
LSSAGNAVGAFVKGVNTMDSVTNAKKRSGMKTAVKPWAKPPAPQLRLTPYAWAKLLYLRDCGDTEIGGFGVSRAGDLLLIEDLALVRQRCDWGSVAFDDAAVADLFDRLVDEGRRPQEFGRIWVHTHPGESPQPSVTDEQTFSRVFGGCDWAVMLIVARKGATYARLRFGVGPGGSVEIPVDVDFNTSFPAADWGGWRAEYDASIEAISNPSHGAAAANELLDPFEWDSEDMLRA